MGKPKSKAKKLKQLKGQLKQLADQGDYCDGGRPCDGNPNSGGPGGYGGGFWINVSRSRRFRIEQQIKTIENTK